MLISCARRAAGLIYGTLFSTVLLCAGCSEPAPSDQTAEATSDATTAPVVVAPTFAPAAPAAATRGVPVGVVPRQVRIMAAGVPGGPMTPGGAHGSPAPGFATIYEPVFEPVFAPQAELSTGGQPVLTAATISWFDPETKEPGARQVGVAANGDLALLEPFTVKALHIDSTGPVPNKFPIHALVTWEGYLDRRNYRSAAIIDSCEVVRLVKGPLHDSAPTTVIRSRVIETRGPNGVTYRERDRTPWKPDTAQTAPNPAPRQARSGELAPGEVPRGSRPVVKKPDPPVPVDSTLELPGEVTAAQVGADGRYLVLAIPSQKQVVIVDVPEQKIAKTIPASESVLIGAGKTKFVLLDPKTRTLVRWSFATLESEQSKNIGGGTPVIMAMSEWGEGPIWIFDKAMTADDPATVRLFDLEKLTSVNVALKKHFNRALEIDLINMKHARATSVTAAGDVIYITKTHSAPLVWKNTAGVIDRVEFPDRPGLFVKPSGQAVRPMADGKAFVQSGEFIQGEKKTRFGSRIVASFPFSTSYDCLSVEWEQIIGSNGVYEPAALIIKFHPNADAASKAELRLADLGQVLFVDYKNEDDADIAKRPFLTFTRRFNYDPASKIFSCVTTKPDRVVFKKFDFDAPAATPSAAPSETPAAPAPADGDVAAAPPPKPPAITTDEAGTTIYFVRGTQVDLQLSPKVVPVGASARLDSGPPGATLTKEGKLSWLPEKDDAGVVPFVVEVTRPGEVRKFVIVQAEAVGPDGAVPAVSPVADNEDRSRGNSEWEQSARFEIDIDRTFGFIVKSAVHPDDWVESETTPTPDRDAYVPTGALSQLTMRGGLTLATYFRMPEKKKLAVEQIKTPFRFVKAQGRSPGSVESVWCGTIEPERVVELPERVVDSVPAGGGRYLLLSLPKIRKVAVFDVREGKLKEYVETDGSDFLVAGGLTRFAVVDRTSNKLRRYNLDTSAIEQTADTTDWGRVLGLGMGVRSEGPIYVAHADKQTKSNVIDAVDLNSLIFRKLQRDEEIVPPGGDCELAVSPDGAKLACDDGRKHTEVLTLTENRLSIARRFENRNRDGFRLAYDGEDLFSDQRRIFATGEELKIGKYGDHLVVGDTYRTNVAFGASFGSRRGSGSIPIQFYCGRDPRPVARVSLEGGDYVKEAKLRLDRRFHCALPEKAAVVIGDLPPRLIHTRIDLDAAIADNPNVPLVVSSSPPQSFPKQADLSYQIELVGKPAGATFRLASGPTDMSVSPTGLVSWKGPPAGESSERGAVVIVADNSGREHVHAFRVPSAATDDVGTTMSGPGPSDQSLTAGCFVPLPGGPTGRASAGDDRYLLLSFGPWQKVAVFDLASGKVARYMETGTTNFFVAGGATKFVVVDPAKREVKRYVLETGALEQTATYPGGPDGVRGVAMGCASEGPVIMWDTAPLPGHATPLRVMDLETLKFRLVDATKSKEIQDHIQKALHSISASADGRAFSPAWRESKSSENVKVPILELAGDRVVARRETGSFMSRPRLSHDGHALVDGRNFNFEGGYSFKLGLLNSVNYCDALWWSEAFHGTSGLFFVCFHQGRSIEKLAQLEVPQAIGATDDANVVRRTYFSRGQKMLAVVSEMPSNVYVKRFDAEAEIARNAVDHLAFTSNHPGVVQAGEHIRFQLTTISRDPMVKYGLGAGPPGMTVSPEGVFEWAVPAGAYGGHDCSVTAENSRGTKVTESFYLRIRKPEPGTKPGAGPSTASRPTPGSVKPTGPTPSGSTPKSPATGLTGAALAAAKLPRKWTSSDGKSTITAAFVELKEGKVVLKPNKGDVIEVELNLLSPADQAHVERIDPGK